jgi:arginine decarboxylase-like protein
MRVTLRGIPTIILAALSLAGGPAFAQTREEVRIAIERTAEVIARAQDIVEGSGTADASADLNLAIQLQRNAETEFAAGRLLRALDLTRRARLAAERAIGRISGGDADRVLAQLERTRELLDRVRERIAECRVDRARSMVQAALEMQVRAEAAAGEKRWLAALRLTMSARERALRALRLCNLEDNLQEAAERALSRTDELISRARDVVADHDGEPARRALHRAVEIQTEAWEQFRSGRYEASLRLTQTARTFAHRAIRIASAG